MKNAKKTTEFVALMILYLVTMVQLVLGYLGYTEGAVVGALATIAAGLGSAGYSISRGQVKAAEAKKAETLPPPTP
jgi:mannitol-specific phosphotransferase system IIBC component